MVFLLNYFLKAFLTIFYHQEIDFLRIPLDRVDITGDEMFGEESFIIKSILVERGGMTLRDEGSESKY